MSDTIEQLLMELLTANPKADANRIKKAYATSCEIHANQFRQSGEPYIVHPVAVARILVKEGFCDEQLLCAALLHDTLEDAAKSGKTFSSAQLREFGPDVPIIVQSLTKVTEVEVGFENFKAENLRKIILASAKDCRVLLIKLADRLHNMRTIASFREEKKKRIAQETLDVFAPLAEKIGLYQFKSELEDRSFHVLEPSMYDFIEEKISLSDEERKKNTQLLIFRVEEILAPLKIIYTISGRAKHYYSIYKKMKESNKTIDQIYDIYGVRIVTQTVEECYRIISMLTSSFSLVQDRFKDYITTPKANGYQSLHANYVLEGMTLEVQVRTKAMDAAAESGAASYWRYKGSERDKLFERKLAWLRQLLRWKKHRPELVDVTLDIFKDEIIVLTPKGDPVILDDHATPIDFAYMIHSDIGSRLKLAKVNGHVVPLNHSLTSGDIVYVETANQSTVTDAWLRMCVMTSTLGKIRRSLGIEHETTPKRKQESKLAYVYTMEDLQVIKRPVKLSQCCNPGPQDRVVAFYTKDKRRVSVHRFDCPNQFALDAANKVQLQMAVTKVSAKYYDVLIKDVPGVLIGVLNTILLHTDIEEVTSHEAHESILVRVKVASTPEVLLAVLRKHEAVIDCKLVVR